MNGPLRAVARACALVVFFAAITLLFRACDSMKLLNENPVLSLVARPTAVPPGVE